MSLVPTTDLTIGPKLARTAFELIRSGLIASAHDVSDGGLLTAVSEMLIASPGLGASLDLSKVHGDPIAAAFSESPSRYILEVAAADIPRISKILGDLPWCQIGHINDSSRLAWTTQNLDMKTDDLAKAWLGTLDW